MPGGSPASAVMVVAPRQAVPWAFDRDPRRADVVAPARRTTAAASAG